MAIIKLGATVVGIRGTVGGLTFSANKSGPLVRAWSKGSNPRTSFQTGQRSTIATIPALWTALTPAEQAAWDTFAALPAQDRTNRLGETFSASGFNWFTLINTRLLNIGRASRTAVPTQAVPAAPTISSLQLPFTTGQTAKIVYPSGTFDPDFDQIIELNIALSIGRQVAASHFLTMLQDQNPPDQDNVFLIPYLARWNLDGPNIKGFAQVYRQTTDGQRSAPTGASFISTDSPGYVATAKDYDGVTNWALRGADLTGNADSKVCTFSSWFRIDGGDGTNRFIAAGTSNHYIFFLTTANLPSIVLRNAAGTTILAATAGAAILAGAAWHNVIWSVDLATARVQAIVDGVAVTPTITTGPTNDTIDWTRTNHAVGASVTTVTPFDGCQSEIYLENVTNLDVTDEALAALFVTPGGTPQDLGIDGSFPTGAQPILYAPNADAAANVGSGGNYTNAAALAACSNAP